MENSEIVSRLVVVLLEGVGNFRGFRVFDFGPYTKIENSENSEIVSRLVKLTDFFCLFEEVGNFQGYRVFGFRPYTDCKNLENSDSFSKLLNFSELLFFLFEETGKFRVFDFVSSAEIENSENFSKYFQGL